MRELDLPQKFVPTTKPGGVRKNFRFESLTLLPGALRIITAAENALVQDGPAASPSTASPARLLEHALGDGSAKREFVYVTEPVAAPPDPPTASSLAGIVELLAVDKTHYLALERSFASGIGHTIRLYLCSIVGATNVRGLNSIAGRTVQPVTKQLIVDLAAFGIVPTNVEGITFGPRLPDGRRSLILVADNNFGATQATQFLAFRYTPGKRR